MRAYCHPTRLPSTLRLPIPDILCHTSPMRRLITSICMTLAVLLGSGGMPWSADFRKGLAAYESGDYARVFYADLAVSEFAFDR